jgi:hypothetical protein
MKKFTSEVASKKEQYGDIIVTVHDKYGNLKQKIEQPVDSFNRHIWRTLQRSFSGLAPAGISLTNQSVGATGDLTVNYFVGGLNSYRGIVVGTSNAAMTYNTVLMGNLIDHGTSSGQLFASAVTAEYDTSTKIATATRTFLSYNPSSSTFSINEVGLTIGQFGSQKDTTFLLVRDVLNTTINVAYEETLTVQYRIRISSGNNNYQNATIRALSTTGQVFAISTAGSTTPIDGNGAWNLLAPIGNSNFGLVVGTSNSAFNVTQINLGNRINHGNNAGELFYHVTTNSIITENATTNSMYFSFFRTVENRSNANISIAEIGLFTVRVGNIIMYDRRVIDPPVVLTNANTVTFNWEFCYEL